METRERRQETEDRRQEMGDEKHETGEGSLMSTGIRKILRL